jgi:hypothetical protein
MNKNLNEKVKLRFSKQEDFTETVKLLNGADCFIYEISPVLPADFNEESPNLEISRLSLTGIIFAVIGIAAGLSFIIWVTTVAYPINFGGKPLLACPSFFIVVFEIAVLSAVIGMFLYFLFHDNKTSVNELNDEKVIQDDDFYLVTKKENLQKINFSNENCIITND